MENNNNEKTTRKETIDITYQGSIMTITLEEFKALQEGWVTFKEMFG